MNIREEDIPDVREESFRYSGPKPQFRVESLVLADAVESASRSLEKPTPKKLSSLSVTSLAVELPKGNWTSATLH